ncbi:MULTISPECIES: hypothetical protein [Burkholderiaceae]|jgi:hypothetical protein|uniref:hypothetical protein n=1 Tax=Burkholderiaceae TaxID=119060 RepID=UPI000D059AA7|nr:MULTISPECIES: hypothetical protein [Burkholderiaceae]MBU9366407.1 hypothetical protein [Burkholderia multivorans]PRZ43851.1 hypothetical protein BX589_14931 [Paraburkholderia fungorum]
MARLFYYHQLSPEQQTKALMLPIRGRPEWQCYVVDNQGAVLQGPPLTPIFQIGMVRVPAASRAQLAALHRAAVEFIVRHAIGDWHEMEPDERAANQLAIEEGAPVLSRYAVGERAEVYVVTPGNRRETRIIVSSRALGKTRIHQFAR